MVVEAMIYMYFVGFGIAAGIATAALISWKLWQRINKPKKRKGAAF
jgi:hypothetical protein